MSPKQQHRHDHDHNHNHNRNHDRELSFPSRHHGRTRLHYRDDDYNETDEHDQERQRESRVIQAENLEYGNRHIAANATSGHPRSRGKDHHWRDHTRPIFLSRSRSRSHEDRVRQVIESAVVAGTLEALRVRKQPGPWNGEKGIRVATAALSAAGIDGLISEDSDRKSKRHFAEAVIGGLLANRLANGPRHKLWY